MARETTYVFYGYGSEYVLHPLYTHMKEAGHDCVELTPDSGNNRQAAQALRGRDVALITSAHVFLDEHFFYFKEMPGALSVLELMDILRPRKSVYYPHDMTYVLHPVDMQYVPTLFDVLLFPFDGFAHYGSYGARVETVGWIKKPERIGSGRKGHMAHAFSNVDFYAHDLRAMYDFFAPVWQYPMDIKCHICPNAAGFERFLREKQCSVQPAETPIFQMIEDSEIILTNAVTSVVFESALSGRFTVNLLDGIFSEQAQRDFFRGLDNVAILSIQEAADLLEDYAQGRFVPPKGKDRLAPFDFEKAEATIIA